MVDVAAFDDGDADIAVAARRVVDEVLAVIRHAATDSTPRTFVVPGPLTERGLAFAGVPGLVRSAIAEYPGDRFRPRGSLTGGAFSDVDESVLAVDEPAIVIQDGAVSRRA